MNSNKVKHAHGWKPPGYIPWNKGFAHLGTGKSVPSYKHGLCLNGIIAPNLAMFRSARQRSVKSGIIFDLRIEDIPSFPSHCPILGIPIFRIAGRKTPNSPSLDRIKPSLGYVRGNVRVISLRANILKSDGNSDEFSLVLNDLREIERQEVDDLARS